MRSKGLEVVEVCHAFSKLNTAIVYRMSACRHF